MVERFHLCPARRRTFAAAPSTALQDDSANRATLIAIAVAKISRAPPVSGIARNATTRAASVSTATGPRKPSNRQAAAGGGAASGALSR